MHRSIAAAALGCTLAAAALPAAAKDQADAEALAKYDRTETFESCIDIQRIQSARILNGHQILFEMNGDKVYLNEPDSCPGLSKSLTLAYDATTGQLCTTTIVHLVDTGAGGGDRGTCGLSKFQLLTPKPKTP